VHACVQPPSPIFPPPQGFRITFHFDPNIYFTNAELSKTYHITNLLEPGSQLEKQEGTVIEWTRGNKLTVQMVKVKSRGKRKGKGAMKEVCVCARVHVSVCLRGCVCVCACVRALVCACGCSQ
jgi:hypothetical protein